MNNQIDNTIKVHNYLKWKLNIRKFNKRPLELKYLHIAKALNLTYKQVRSAIDLLCDIHYIEKFNAWSADFKRKNYYRYIKI